MIYLCDPVVWYNILIIQVFYNILNLVLFNYTTKYINHLKILQNLEFYFVYLHYQST